MSATATTTTTTPAVAGTIPQNAHVPPKAKPQAGLEHYKGKISKFVAAKKFEKLFDQAAIDAASVRAKKMGDGLNALGCHYELGIPLSILVLYDIVILIDDSTSMTVEEDGKRIATLKTALDEITKVFDLANDDGIKSVRFINNRQGKGKVRNTRVEEIFKDRVYEGGTMMGTALKKKVLDPFVYKKKLEKPLLVMTVTDGEVEGEYKGYVKKVIKDCMEKLDSDPEKVAGSVAFHFSRVGNDEGAMKLLDHLDNCPEVGKYVDCLPMEAPLERLNEQVVKWRLLEKILLGAIDDEIDSKTFELGPTAPTDDLAEISIEDEEEVEDD